MTADHFEFAPQAVLDQEWIDDLDVDARHGVVAYSLRRTAHAHGYTSEVHHVAIDGADRVLATSSSPAARARLHPDGDHVLYLDGAGAERAVHLVPVAAPGAVTGPIGELRGVTRAEWSPDGEHLLALAPSGVHRFGRTDVAREIRSLTWRRDGAGIRDQYTSLWVMRRDGSGLRRLGEPTYEVSSATWADPDTILFVADLSATAHLDELPQLWTVARTGGPVTPRGRLRGRITDVAADRAGQVAITGVDIEGAPLYAPFHTYLLGRRADAPADILGGAQAAPTGNPISNDVIDTSYNMTPRVALVGDREALVVTHHRGCSYPTLVTPDGQRRLLDGERVTTVVAGSPALRAAISTEAGYAPEVHLLGATTSAARRLTSRGSRWLPTATPRPTRETISVGADSVDVWLLPGRQPTHGRVVLHLHGGPYAAHGPVTWTEMLALASVGISVVFANPPGSVRYDDRFARALIGRWAEADREALRAVVGWAIERDLAHPRRVGIMGLSYGGMATLAMLASYPGLFAAGLAENPVSYLPSYDGSCDLGTGIGGLGLDPYPHAAAEYLRQSPVLQLTRATPPTLIMQAEDDLRCPYTQGLMAFHRLHDLGCDTRLVTYPHESHRLCIAGRPDHRVDRLTRITEWFDQQL